MPKSLLKFVDPIAALKGPDGGPLLVSRADYTKLDRDHLKARATLIGCII